jgi:(1->4)-alpha-D-glucan 1-alpha-D-glucosylmutase
VTTDSADTTHPSTDRSSSSDRPSRQPGSTYRLQLTTDFGFAEAAELVPYLKALGVTHLYLSPLLTALEGSTHGYDVADPTTVSAALGGQEALRDLADAAHAEGLGLVGDIVPNHVGTGAENPLWERLLAEGHAGSGNAFFDVDWETPLPGASGKVVLPILGDSYGAVLESGELEVVEVDGQPRLRYHEHSFPLAPPSVEALERSGGIEAVRGEPGKAESWKRLHALIEQQHYRLIHWRAGDALVNYRRFFAINELAGVRVEEESVFEHMHAKIRELVADGVLDGLRIDHVDGLADPSGYLAALHDAVDGAWTVVEKILAPGEVLEDWPVAGGTGYDFLGDVLRLYIDPSAEESMTETARAFDAWPAYPDEAMRDAKIEVMRTDLLGDTDRVARRLWALAQEHPKVRDVSFHACRAVVVGTIAQLPVYRTYIPPGGPGSPRDVERVAAAVAAARQHPPGQPDMAPDFLWDFLEPIAAGQVNGPLRDEFVRRYQQLSGAAMAKGVEDTFLYRQHRLAALNEVGVEPEPFGADVAAFHTANLHRAETAPLAMLTTATHDTKRGEGVRLRIAALSEEPEQWRDAVGKWLEENRRLVVDTDRGPAPDPATEYLLYQTLIGIWPLDGLRTRLAELTERLVEYMVKASREAGVRTTWTDPDEQFEEALERFIRRLLDPAESSQFLDEVASVAEPAVETAMVSGLSQVLLRSTSPGVPDTYQGAEVWRDNLVDPDNRRPVDFARRAELLAELDDGVDLARVWTRRRDGAVKLWVLSRALRARASHPGCFGPRGTYEPLEVTGRWAAHVVAFARRSPDGDVAVTIAPRLPGRLTARGQEPLADTWGDTAVRLGDLAGALRTDVIGQRDVPDGEAAELALRDVLVDLPVALLVS